MIADYQSAIRFRGSKREGPLALFRPHVRVVVFRGYPNPFRSSFRMCRSRFIEAFMNFAA
jgi:hypothetical protein